MTDLAEDLETVKEGARASGPLPPNEPEQLVAASSRVAWAHWKRARERARDFDDFEFRHATGNAWAAARAACDDCPQRAAQHYARWVLKSCAGSALR